MFPTQSKKHSGQLNLKYQTRKTCDLIADNYTVLDSNWGLDKGFISKAFFGKSNLRVLDAGCGPGLHTKFILDKFDSKINHVTGVDFSSGMLAVARKNIGKNPKVTLKKMDLLKLRLPRNSFDIILCMNVLGNIIENDIESSKNARLRVLRRLFGLLLPNGLLLCSVYDLAKANVPKDYQRENISFAERESRVVDGDFVVKVISGREDSRFYSHWFLKTELICLMKKCGFINYRSFFTNKRLFFVLKKQGL